MTVRNEYRKHNIVINCHSFTYRTDSVHQDVTFYSFPDVTMQQYVFVEVATRLDITWFRALFL